MKKFAKIFKTLSLLALVMLTVATPVFGGSVTPDLSRMQEKQSAIYNHIADDFMLLTGLEKQQADTYLAEISRDENVARLSDEVLQILPVLSAKAEYGKNAIYIQDNYDQIVANLSPADKVKIDKYYLTGVLQYYDEYATSEDIENLNQDGNEYTYNSRSVQKEPAPEADIGAVIENRTDNSGEIVLQENGAATRAPAVAAVRLFASVDGASSSTKDLGHAWLTVENLSRSNINVGKFGIAPGKTISIGTWSGQSEHTGLWYCLESKLISKSSSQWKKRTSIKVNIGAASLGKLTDFIVKSDKWSIFNNCSSFATKGWNLVASTKISAGAINTPATTQSNIIKTGLASTGIKVPHYFAVYYAQGTNRPKKSTVH